MSEREWMMVGLGVLAVMAFAPVRKQADEKSKVLDSIAKSGTDWWGTAWDKLQGEGFTKEGWYNIDGTSNAAPAYPTVVALQNAGLIQ